MRHEVGPAVNLALPDGKKTDSKWWLARAFADVLGEAERSSLGVEVSGDEGDNAAYKGGRWLCEGISADGGNNASRPPSLQKAIYMNLLEKADDRPIHQMLPPRLRHFISQEQISDEAALHDMQFVLSVAKKISPSAAWNVIKVWCNSWMTTSRTGSKKISCLFGCGASFPDSLAHYLVCGRLHVAAINALSGRLLWTPTCCLFGGLCLPALRNWNPARLIWVMGLGVITHRSLIMSPRLLCVFVR